MVAFFHRAVSSSHQVRCITSPQWRACPFFTLFASTGDTRSIPAHQGSKVTRARTHWCQERVCALLMRVPHLLVCREASRFFPWRRGDGVSPRSWRLQGRVGLACVSSSRLVLVHMRCVVLSHGRPFLRVRPSRLHPTALSHPIVYLGGSIHAKKGGVGPLPCPPPRGGSIQPWTRPTPWYTTTLDRSDMEASSSSDGDACRFEDSPLESASSESGGDEVGGAKARGEEAEARVLTQERNARRRGRTRCWRRKRCAGGRWKPWKGCATCFRWRKTWPTRC